MMKKTIHWLLAFVSFVAFGNTLCAQEVEQRLTREQLAEVQARHIARVMEMDEQTSDRFVDTYCQFQREIWGLGPRPRRPRRELTEEEAGEALKNRFDHSQKILALRQKYYGIYSEFLTQKQIRRVYELERQMMERLFKPGRHGRGGMR